MRYYAGVGSRKTPSTVLPKMVRVAQLMSTKHFCLRSGGAVGADTAFEYGARGFAAIFKADDATEAAIELASQFHPAWDRCDAFARKLHGRNAMILLGPKLDKPVEFGVCWTHNGQAVGGTGMAIRMAKAYEIEMFNLFHEYQEAALVEVIKEGL